MTAKKPAAKKVQYPDQVTVVKHIFDNDLSIIENDDQFEDGDVVAIYKKVGVVKITRKTEIIRTPVN